MPFYWLSFVQEVRKSWGEDLTGEPPQKIGMLKRNGRVLYVHDYVHRPEELDGLLLYDWISNYKCGKLPTKNIMKSAQRSPLNDEAEENDCEENCVQDELEDELTDDDGNDSDGGPNSCSDLTKDTTVSTKGMLCFTTDHPLFATYGLKHLSSPLVPNYVGQTLPRRDQSDREFYCTTMLTLFKPWRTGTTLKTKDVSWDEAFIAHTFSK